MLQVNQLVGFYSRSRVSRGTVTYVYRGYDEQLISSSGASMWTSNGWSFGSAGQKRVLVAIGWRAANVNVVSVTIGGAVATLGALRGNTSNRFTVFAWLDTTLSAGNIKVQFSGGISNGDPVIGVYSLYGVQGSSVHDEQTGQGATTITVPSGGLGVAFAVGAIADGVSWGITNLAVEDEPPIGRPENYTSGTLPGPAVAQSLTLQGTTNTRPIHAISF